MTKHSRPRLLIEDWLPAAAIGVECMRERGSASALAPHSYLHVWWARRPLCASRAAVLGSLLPSDFSHELFERLLGFGRPGNELVKARKLMDSGKKLEGGFGCKRAYKNIFRDEDLKTAHSASQAIFGNSPSVIDPMSGGGSIPFESLRLGFRTYSNEYNPVACSILETTLEYPSRFGKELPYKARVWSKEWLLRIEKRIGKYFPKRDDGYVHAYIFARTIPCPDTEKHPHTPIVPDWHLYKPKGSNVRVWAEPVVDKKAGTWSVRIIDTRKSLKKSEPPKPTYGDGDGISLFSGLKIGDDYIKAKAQAGEMGSALFAVVVKGPKGLEFHTPTDKDHEAIIAASKELAKHRKEWEQDGIIPTELYQKISSDERPIIYGMPRWADLFSSRQLLGISAMLAELKTLREEIIKQEGQDLGEAISHLLSFSIDKFINYNSVLASWHAPRQVMRSVFDRHDFSFKASFAEMAPCSAGRGVDWAIDNTLDSFEKILDLPRNEISGGKVSVSMGSATNLPQIENGTISAVVVDPPYADNVQYSELADFFYVWLKRTQGHRRPEWFSRYLCDHSEEAVVNVPRHREASDAPGEAKKKANEFYQNLMSDVFKECHRILSDNGALTVMFTHKKQEAWEALFTSLVKSGFTITATWPIKTESENSLHQAKKNAAQSTVVLVARKRFKDAEVGYYDAEMKRAVREAAQKTAERLHKEGLNPVDQLVGSFGPAMEVYSQYTEVRTDTGDPVGVDRALDEASDAVTEFRIKQLAARGLDGVEAEGKFYLLCWDVIQAAEFRFNEAKLLGHAVGMDVDTLVVAGLVSKTGDKIKLLSAQDRRRAKKLEQEEVEETLFGAMPTGKGKRVKKGDVLKVHPNDPRFRTALDACHALSLRYIEAKGGNPGLGSARQLAVQQGWKGGSPVARLMEALLKAAPPALWYEKGKTSAAALYPEFRAWHAIVEPLFGAKPPDWIEEQVESDMPLFAGTETEAIEEPVEDGDTE